MSACSRPQPVEVVRPDPSVKSTPAPSPTPTMTPTPSATAPSGDFHLCEPVVRCGFWSKCVWLERVDASHYRAIGGDATKGEVFVRRHHCHPVDGGARCSVYCTGVDGGAPCRDGFSPEKEACDESAPPSPNSIRCAIGAGICGSLM
jgi:hypothetical protein